MQTTNKNKVTRYRQKALANTPRHKTVRNLKMKNVAIIGAGISGLVAGYLLSKQNFQVTIYERDSEIGGLLQSTEHPDISVEKYYHHFFKSDKDFIKLVEEIGLNNKICWHRSSISFLRNGQFFGFNGPKDLFALPFLGLWSRLRFGLGYLYVKSLPYQFINKSQTANQLIINTFGSEVYEKIWKPLLKGKFHTFYDIIAASWFAARIKTRNSSKDRNGEKLGYLDGGFQTFTKNISNKIVSAGGTILLDKKIRSVEQVGKNLIVDKSKYDIVISTAPNILRISKVRYLGSISVVLKLKNKLTDCYWTNILDKRLPFKVMVEQTNLVSPRNYHGSHIVYLGEYIDVTSKRFRYSDEETENEYLGALSTIFPTVRADLISCNVYRTTVAQPIIIKNYKKPSYKTDLPNCYELTMAHIHPEDRGMNYAIKAAKELVRIILDR